MAKSAGANRRTDENKINPGIKITLIVVALLCVVMLAYSAVDALGIIDRNTTAMTVGEDEITVTELNQYYHTTRNGFLNQYGDYLSMYGYDLYNAAAFDMQPSLFDSNKTWKEYFLIEAQAAAEEVSLLAQEANKAGYTMTAEDQEQYDLYMESLKSAAEANNMSVAKYCKALYGAGTKVSDVESYYQKRVLSAGYYNTVLEGFGIDDAAIDAHYAENGDDYDELTYFLYDVDYKTYTYSASSTEEGAPKSEDEAKQLTAAEKEAAKKDAAALLNKLNGSNFDEVCAAYDEAETFKTAEAQSVVSEIDGKTVVGAWLLDESRKAGDTAVLDDEDNSSMTLIQYVGRALSDDYTVAVRHALVAFESAGADATDEEKAAVEAANAAKKGEAEALYEEWKSAGATEEAFIELAKEHSADSNAAQGGIYTGVFQGQMVTEFNDWCFDESRKPGDHGIVETSYGYHLMYFVENEGLSYRGDIKDALQAEQYNEYLNGLKETSSTTYNAKALNLM